MLMQTLDQQTDELRRIALAQCFQLARERGRLILQQQAQLSETLGGVTDSRAGAEPDKQQPDSQ